jgi:DNA repair protein RadC
MYKQLSINNIVKETSSNSKETFYKLRLIRTPVVGESTFKVESPDQIYNKYRAYFNGLDREHFEILHLDTKNKITSKEIISIGSLNQSIVHPREVFKSAILNNSASIILLHNHPSGDPKPSRQDIDVTKRLEDAGNILGITVIDHVIFGESGYISFKEECIL